MRYCYITGGTWISFQILRSTGVSIATAFKQLFSSIYSWVMVVQNDTKKWIMQVLKANQLALKVLRTTRLDISTTVIMSYCHNCFFIKKQILDTFLLGPKALKPKTVHCIIKTPATLMRPNCGTFHNHMSGRMYQWSSTSRPSWWMASATTALSTSMATIFKELSSNVIMEWTVKWITNFAWHRFTLKKRIKHS